eukprot:bmy_17997T0
MRYADPSANRDLLGNRTLLFIFICAFALVTLLQQILYGRNYIKRGLQFGWQSGDQLANWTGIFNVMDDPAVQSGSDSSSRYFEFYEGPFEYNSTRCLELRHEILEVKVLSMDLSSMTPLFSERLCSALCHWSLSVYLLPGRSTLSRCCNAPSFLFTTQKNTPLGTKLKYEVDTSGIYHINREIFHMFPKDMPYYRSQFKKCAVVGNGGILKNSRCGREINSADFVFRFHKLEKWRRPFYRVLQVYENASVLLPAFYNTRNTDVSIRVKYVLDDFESPQAVYYFHPQYLVNVSRYWLSLGVRAKRISTGLILATAALELCEEVHLFGFWAFPMNPSGLSITHHYYDNVKPRPGFHAMPSEIFNFLHLHSRGILRVHTGTCNCC